MRRSLRRRRPLPPVNLTPWLPPPPPEPRQRPRARRRRIGFSPSERVPEAPPKPWEPPKDAPHHWCITHRMEIVHGDPAHAICEVNPSLPGRVGSAQSMGSGRDAEIRRYPSGITGFDRVVGQGTYKGRWLMGLAESQWVTLSAPPGTGKSTLTNRIAYAYAVQGKLVLIVSAEENIAQIKGRLSREGCLHKNIRVCHTGSWEEAETLIFQLHPFLVVIDSQDEFGSMHGGKDAEAGSDAALGAIGKRIAIITKGNVQGRRLRFRPAFIVIRHINAKGIAKGQKTHTHKPDTVMRFAHLGEYRELGTDEKNRFGPSPMQATFGFRNGRLTEIKPEETGQVFPNLGEVGEIATCIVHGGAVTMALVECESRPLRGEKDSPRHDIVGAPRHLLASVLDLLRDEGIDPARFLRHIRVRVAKAEGEVKDDSIALALYLAVASDLLGIKPPAMAAFGSFSLRGDLEAASKTRERLSAIAKFGILITAIPLLSSREGEDPAGVHRFKDAAGALAYLQTAGVHTLPPMPPVTRLAPDEAVARPTLAAVPSTHTDAPMPNFEEAELPESGSEHTETTETLPKLSEVPPWAEESSEVVSDTGDGAGNNGDDSF